MGQVDKLYPVYCVFCELTGVAASYTGKGTSALNGFFSFSRTRTTASDDILLHNLEQYAASQHFDLAKLTWPHGSWPHSGNVITAEDHTWAAHPRVGGIIPSTDDGEPVAYDGIVTRSSDFVLGVQGADCPAVFFHDQESMVIGLAHSGWKPTVRGVIRKVVNAMVELGADRQRIAAFVSPGVGDRYNEFGWDEAMDSEVRQVFVKAGREDISANMDLRHELSEQEREELEQATGRGVRHSHTFKLSFLIESELLHAGIRKDQIMTSEESTVVGQYEDKMYRFHSYRRDRGEDPMRPGYGLSMSTIFLMR